MTLLAIFITALAGLAIAFQAKILSDLDLKMGALGNMFVNFFFGSIAVFFILLVASWVKYKNLTTIFSSFGLTKVPSWQLTTGLCGIIIVSSIGWSASKIGVSNTLILVFFFQILVGALIDHYGWLGSKEIPFNWIKAASLSLVFVGAYFYFKN